MGTRGIMGVRIDGQDKLTYNHWDSYPSGLGEEMVSFIRQITDLASFKEKIRSLKLVKEDATPTPEQVEQLSAYLNTGVGEPGRMDWYKLLRETQGDLKATLDAGFMIDSHGFMKNSLFCEWAYIVNADEDTFEIYEGFQQKVKDQKGRYAVKHKPSFKPTYKGQEQYLPVSLIATFPLSDIPEDWVEQVNPKEVEA